MPQKHAWTDAERCDVSERFAAGEGALGIGKSYGFVTGKAVVDLLKDLGEFEPNRKFQGQFTPAQKAEMVRRYLAGETMAGLATEYGCERTNVRVILKTRGVRFRDQKMVTDAAEDARIRAMREQRLSIREIADALGVSKHRVLARARALGLADKKMPRGPKNSLWAGGRTYKHSTGYLYVAVDLDDPLRCMASANGQVPEHRLVMARSLGRPLTRQETVHHINGDRTDNRLDNLQLRKGNHGKGVVMACLDCGSHNVGAVPIA